MSDNPRIGKDVIESLTLGMYEKIVDLSTENTYKILLMQ